VTWVSSYRKGLRSKRRVRKYYEEQGWAVADVEDMSKYGETDKFGIADLIIICDGDVRLVQVKTNAPETQAVMEHVCERLGVKTVCATWYDYDGLRVQVYSPKTTKAVPDRDEFVESQEVPRP